uniref:Uncharacterized protein n=1 Tax=Lotharella oceanica TaxID=641309 RepID=A0A7S2TJC6_9EUKA
MAALFFMVFGLRSVAAARGSDEISTLGQLEPMAEEGQPDRSLIPFIDPMENNATAMMVEEADPEKTKSEDWPVVMSYLAYGPPMRMRILIDNATEHTKSSTKILLHISEKTIHKNCQGVDVDWEWLLAQNASDASRLYINPVSIKVRPWSGLILRGHLHNFKFAKAVIGPGNEFIFCMMSSDTALHRSGAEEYIQRHKISFTLGFTGDRKYELDQRRNETKSRMLAAIQSNHPERIPSKRMRAYQSVEYYQTQVMHTDLWRKLAAAGIVWDLDKQSFINQFQHEGTFFPSGVIERFQERLTKYNLKLTDIPYFAEEIWIPSYVLKNEQDLLQRYDFAPPLVGRYRHHFWIDYCCTNSREEMKKMLLESKDEEWYTGWDTVYGTKYMESPWEVETAIQVTRRCRESADECTFYPNLCFPFQF